MTNFDSLIGLTVGKFRVLRKLGEGGMAAVYLAERIEDFHQHVALKLLLQGGIHAATLQRFRIEQQALAALQHPGIVHLMDAGISADGIPYFAMEHVDGQALDLYCNSRQLSVSDRIRLMLQVLDAVDYAHQRFLVHCDLKFSNILVDSAGHVKLLDFGISKLLQPTVLGGDEGVTKATPRPFTPEFASPEQLNSMPLSTAVDIYSSGVVLHLLLAGLHPFEALLAEPVKLLRAVSELEAPACGRAFRRLTREDPARAATIAEQRGTLPEALAANLDGDLDAILGKALRNSATDRYGSAAAMAADLRAFLEMRPVSARGPSLLYRASRLSRRHQGLAALTVALALLTVTAVGSWVWQSVRASDSRARAEARFSDVRQLTNSLLFEFYDAVEKLPGATPAQESLVRWSLEYLDELGRNFSANDRLRADHGLDLEIAESYWKLGNILGNPYQSNLGKPQEGVDAHTKGLSLVGPILARDADDRDAVLMAAKLYGSRSQVRWLLDQTADCLADARVALQLLEPLAARYPSDYDVQMQKTVQHEMLSDLVGGAYSVELNQDEARRHLRAAMEHAELASQADPSQVRPRRAKVVMQYKLAELLSLDNPKAALEAFENALLQFRQLPVETQQTTGSQRLRQ
ncbi:MAG: serine/threonine protein kinase, partial [Bryobacterales bacterium]|nr:serine/threonine protein kinase [Bryobacterales bacterium]